LLKRAEPYQEIKKTDIDSEPVPPIRRFKPRGLAL